jgi:hypothetical protein
MAIEEPTVGGHSVGEPYAGLVMPYEFLELSLGELCAMRAHQVLSAIMLSPGAPTKAGCGAVSPAGVRFFLVIGHPGAHGPRPS